MNKRLACIASHIEMGKGMIDVGTDHAYLPVEMIRRGYTGQVFASDIRKGPLLAARRTAEEAGVSDRITLQLCDGLDACDPDVVDTIVIAGMGGDTICGILDRAEWCMSETYHLILQPMTKAEVLRYWLVHNEFAILQEDLVKDAGTIYQVFTARFGGETRLRDAELFSGSYSLIQKQALTREYLEQLNRRNEKILSGLEKDGTDRREGKLRIHRNIQAGLKEMIQCENGQ